MVSERDGNKPGKERNVSALTDFLKVLEFNGGKRRVAVDSENGGKI